MQLTETNKRSEIPVVRHRGAQPGIHNTLKHRFYSKQLKGENFTGLDPAPHTGLADDIVILKMTIRRLVDIINNSTTSSEIIEATRALFLGYQSLTRLVKTQHLLTRSENPIFDDLRQAIDAVHLELTGDPS